MRPANYGWCEGNSPRENILYYLYIRSNLLKSSLGNPSRAGKEDSSGGRGQVVLYTHIAAKKLTQWECGGMALVALLNTERDIPPGTGQRVLLGMLC